MRSIRKVLTFERIIATKEEIEEIQRYQDSIIKHHKANDSLDSEQVRLTISQFSFCRRTPELDGLNEFGRKWIASDLLSRINFLFKNQEKLADYMQISSEKPIKVDFYSMGRVSEQLIKFYFKSPNENVWFYKGNVYLVSKIINDEESELLIFEEFDQERKLFERLKKKHLSTSPTESDKSRPIIPEHVRIEVWRRDGGKCVKCGSREYLEYDHIIPISKGGSNTARNIELLCEKCNRSKGANIQ